MKELDEIYESSESLYAEIDLILKLQELVNKTVGFNELDAGRLKEAYGDVQTLSFVLTEKLEAIKESAKKIVERLLKVS